MWCGGICAPLKSPRYGPSKLDPFKSYVAKRLRAAAPSKNSNYCSSDAPENHFNLSVDLFMITSRRICS